MANYERTQADIDAIYEMVDGERPIVPDSIVNTAEMLADAYEHEELHDLSEVGVGDDDLERGEDGLPEVYHRAEILTTEGVHYARIRGVGWIGTHPEFGFIISSARDDDPDADEAEFLHLGDLLPSGRDEMVVFDVTVRIGMLTSEAMPIPLWDAEAERVIPPSSKGKLQN